jgi:hypothetical protein
LHFAFEFGKAMLPVFSLGKIIGISTHVSVDPCSQYKPGLTYAEGERRAREKRADRAFSVCQ